MNPLSKMFYLSRLNKYSSYDEHTHGIKITYNYSSEEFAEVRKCYKLNPYVQRHSFADMQQIMHTVFHTLSSTQVKKPILQYKAFSSISLYRMKEESDVYVSCWGYAQTLTECFLAVGIPARMVRVHSGLFYDFECHCVCVAYCAELKKNVLFDVANNVIYYSEKCVPLDLNEFREFVTHNKRIIVLQNKKGEKSGLITYWLKNLIVFQCFEREKFGNALNESDNRVVYLLPEKLNLQSNILLKTNCTDTIITRNSNEFWQLPSN